MKNTHAIIVLLLHFSPAWACQCSPVKFTDEVRVSEKIFHGRVISVTDNHYELEVLRGWKGVTPGEHVSIVQGRTSCERRIFELNQEYIFYMHGTSVWNCSRTALYNPISLDPELLDLEFYRIGDRDSVYSATLTAREVSMLKSFLVIRNISTTEIDAKLEFAIDKHWVNKWSFFNALQPGMYKIEIFQLTMENGPGATVLWMGENWRKSSRKLRRTRHHIPQQALYLDP